MSTIFGISIISLILGSIGAWVVFINGDKIGLADIPKERSSHSLSTPKGGGIGILTAFFFVCLYLNISWTLWFPSLMLALISFWGDKHEISPKLRLVFQFLLSGILLWSIDLVKFSLIYEGQVSAGMYVIAVLFFSVFIAGTANIYNFMDGINGLAAITGIIAFLLLGLMSLDNKIPDYPLLAISISLSILGFLPFNFPKANVFMGDVGSVLLGFVFAAFVLLVSKNWHDFLCYTAFIFPFYIDEVTTMLERIRKKEALTVAHRTHFYQLLVNEKKILHWKVSLGYGTAQIIVSVFFICLRPYHIVYTLTLYLLLALIAFIGSYSLRKHLAFP